MSQTEYRFNQDVEEEKRLQEFIEKGNSRELLKYFQENPDVSDSILYKCLYKAILSNGTHITRIVFAAGADISHGNHLRLLSAAMQSKNLDLIQMLIEENIHVELPASPAANSAPLQVAVVNGDLDILKVLLSAGTSLDFEDAQGFSAMHTAAQNSKDAVKILIDSGCSINVQTTGKGYTPLHCAVRKELVDMVKFLLEHGADPGIPDKRVGFTALHMAVVQGNKEIVELLLKKMKPEQINQLNHLSQSCLHEAAAENRTELIEMLIKAGARTDISISLCAPDLITLSNDEVLYILEYKTNGILLGKTDALNEDRCTPLMCAVENGHVECAAEILRHTPANFFRKCIATKSCTGNTVLHMLAKKGKPYEELLESILNQLDSQKILNDVNNDGETALMVATKHDNIKPVALLIIAGADVNIGCKKIGSPLHAAVLLGQDVARVLLESPLLRLDVCDASEETALHKAAFVGNSYMLEAMLDKGVSAALLNKQSVKGNTILHYLVENSTNDDLLRVLQKMVECGLKLDLQNKDGDTALVRAAKHKSQNVQGIEELLRLGAQVNIANKIGRTALHYTFELKRTYVSYCLLEYGAECNVLDKDGNTPLHLAAANEDDQIVLRLLMKKTRLDTIGHGGQTALHVAATCGNIDVVNILLEQGARVEVPGSSPSPLINAARSGHAEIIKLLLEKGAKINAVDKMGRSALMWAAQGGHIDCIKELLENNADTKITDESDDTALTLAAWAGNTDAVKMLIPVSDINHREREEGMSALYLAIGKNHKDCVQLLLDAGADINLIDAHGNTALLTAAMLTTGPEILEMILNCGRKFDINAVGCKGRTAVHWAVGEPLSTQVLVQHKPDLNHLDENKASPLLLAIAHGQPQSAEILIKSGCDVNMVHVDGRKPIHHAAIYGDPNTTQLLIDHGVDPDTPMKDGRRPLLLACIENNVSVVKILLKYKIDINRIYANSFTALSVAVTNSFDEIIQILLDAGADPNVIGEGKYLPLIHSIIQGYMCGTVLLVQAGAYVNVAADAGKYPVEVAILKKNLKALQFLLEVGADPNLLRTVIQEGTIIYFIEDDFLLNAVTYLSKQPLSLHILSRDVIRQHLKKPFVMTVNQVNLPQSLKDFVLMVDLKKKWITK